MTIECYCEPIEGEPCTVWNVSWRVARKDHKCCECQETIKIGERYQYTFTVFEGEASPFKTCAFCAEEYERLRNKYPEGSFCPGDLACVVVWDMRNEGGP